MSIAEMKKAIIARIDTFSEAELEELLKSMELKKETWDILASKDKILRENHEVFKKLAQ